MMLASTAGTRWGPCHGPLELRDLSLLLGHLALLRLRWCAPLPENHLQLMGAKHQTSGLVLPTWQSYWGAIPRNTVNIYIYIHTQSMYIYIYVCGLWWLIDVTSRYLNYQRLLENDHAPTWGDGKVRLSAGWKKNQREGLNGADTYV